MRVKIEEHLRKKIKHIKDELDILKAHSNRALVKLKTVLRENKIINDAILNWKHTVDSLNKKEKESESEVIILSSDDEEVQESNNNGRRKSIRLSLQPSKKKRRYRVMPYKSIRSKARF